MFFCLKVATGVVASSPGSSRLGWGRTCFQVHSHACWQTSPGSSWLLQRKYFLTSWLLCKDSKHKTEITAFLYLNLGGNLAMGFSNGSAVKNPPAMQETQEMQVQSLGREDL